MLESLKKWFGSADGHPRSSDLRSVANWAQAQQWTFRRVREANGFVVDGRWGATPWRLEWGPSQRSYVTTQELRFRVESQVPWDLQALVLNRELQEAMEKDVYDQYIEGVQTRVDTRTPPEMRWLIMFPKLSGHELKSLRERWAAVSNHKPWIERWLDGPLNQALSAYAPEAGTPLALMISRGRLTLRTAMPEIDCAGMAKALSLFETAWRQGEQVAVDFAEPVAPSTQPSMFTATELPEDAAAH